MKSIGIIGGGPSGILSYCHLLAQNKGEQQLRIFVFEKSSEPDQAFSGANEWFLLNVPAGRMGWSKNESSDFHRWLLNNNTPCRENDFVARKLFGKYLTEKKEQIAAAFPECDVVIVNEEVTHLERNGNSFAVTAGGKVFSELESVILAAGNFSPAIPKSEDKNFINASGWFNNPWQKNLLENISAVKNILLFGSGLTSVDLLVQLHRKGHRGKINVLSPHGYLPLPHVREEIKYPDFRDEISSAGNVVEIFSVIKKHLKLAEKKTIPWQAVIDAFRPYVQETWKRFSLRDKEMFMRHLRHLWGVARHRMPFEQAEIIYSMLNRNQLKVIAGRSTNIVVNGNGKFKVYFASSNAADFGPIQADVMINCTGPEMNISKVDSQLFRSLLKSGVIKNGPLGLGVMADYDGRIIDQSNKIVEGLYTIGSSLRGVLWETTAIPEIRSEAENIARNILGK